MSDSFRARITSGDVTNNNLLLASLGENRYRVEEVPLLTESVFYGDMIEAEYQSDGSLLSPQRNVKS